ncbi:hypothetical protein PDESU_06528 [Pontiella desulfatans]|uniref:Uncharacterized protein n=1 Tax=Pontiella desulfatans TaxID=2750659 RepID=A0A6C2UFF2_PONDE|nr:tetratricopeptide repeat protein [Pontiella desulfatans]VGO17926.1 hypothetical protein PDESU_06528 [Pontiella desulfatans]
MKTGNLIGCVVVGSCLLVQGAFAAPGSDDADKMVVYEVNRSVADFPMEEDFSTPESAYAAINRVMAKSGNAADWDRVSGKSQKKNQEFSDRGTMWTEAFIREVNVYKGVVARVFAQVRTKDGEVKFDQRSVILKDGQWFNQGQDGLVDSLEEARAIFEKKKERLNPSWKSRQNRMAREYAAAHPDEFRAAATRLFEAIRTAGRITDHEEMIKHLDESNIYYTVHSDYPAWTAWIYRSFKDNPIVDVSLGEPLIEGEELPAFPYSLTLEDGTKLEGRLPFKYYPQGNSWCGIEGLDWHLKPARVRPAGPIAVLLEQGIYTEETVGDLSRAIEIYSEIVDADQANRKVVAEALFRLGRCYVEEGKTAEAVRELRKIVNHYLDQERYVRRAEKLIDKISFHEDFQMPFFPQVVDCRLLFAIQMDLEDSPKVKVGPTLTCYQTDMVSLSLNLKSTLEGKIDCFDLVRRPVGGAIGESMVETVDGSFRSGYERSLENEKPGLYDCEVIGYQGTKVVTHYQCQMEIKPAIMTQISINDIMPDGSIQFSSIQQTPGLQQRMTTQSFISSDFVHIEEMFDEFGTPVEFSETHERNIFRYSMKLNKPAEIGDTLYLESRGWIDGLVNKVSNTADEFIYRMNHSPSAGRTVRRVEIYRIPPETEWLDWPEGTSSHRTLNDGKNELYLEREIPAGGSLLTEFRYRLSNESGKYVKQFAPLKKKADTEEKREALERVEQITANATFHVGALVELAKLVPTAEFNHQRIVKAAELASMFVYNTLPLLEVARIAAKADRECEELDEILELVVRKLGSSPMLVQLARDAIKAADADEKEAIRARITEFQESADYQTLAEALEGQKTLLDPPASKYKPLGLQPAPWKDGDALRFRLLTKTGMEMGHLVWAVNGVEHEGKACWKVEQRLVVPSAGSIMASHVIAEKESFIPISGHTTHQLGSVDATYLPGKVLLRSNGAAAPREVEVPDPIYDNEQVIFLMRHLPLAEQYKASFPIMSVLSGAEGLECRIRVLKRESIDVASESHDCWKIRIQVYMGAMKAVEQTAWFTVENHVPVKFVTDQMDMLLAEHTSARQETMELKAHGARIDLPKDWFGYVLPSAGKDSEIVRLLPPDMKLTAMLCKDIRDTGVGSPKSAASKDIKVLKGYHKNYQVRQNSQRTNYADGLKVSHVFAADYEEQGREMTEYRAYFTADSRVFWFVFRMDRGEFESVRDELDAIIDGLKIILDPDAGITPFAHARKLKVEFTSEEAEVPFYCRANVPESKELEGEYTTPVVLTSEQNRLDVTILPTSSGSVRADLRAGVLNNVSYSGSTPFRLQAGKNGTSSSGDSRFQTFFTTIRVMDGDAHVGTGKFRFYRQKMTVIQLDGYVLKVDAAVEFPDTLTLKMQLLKAEGSEVLTSPSLTLKGGEEARMKISADGTPSYTIEVETMEL